MVKTYVSAIKRILIDDGYLWNQQRILLNALTKTCRLVNDKVFTRLPIQCGLLELMLYEFERMFQNSRQFYLDVMYKAIFLLGYYGLMRVGELTLSKHVMKGANVHVALNRRKILIVLYSSKTHTSAMRPQKIRITSFSSQIALSYR